MVGIKASVIRCFTLFSFHKEMQWKIFIKIKVKKVKVFRISHAIVKFKKLSKKYSILYTSFRVKGRLMEFIIRNLCKKNTFYLSF